MFTSSSLWLHETCYSLAHTCPFHPFMCCLTLIILQYKLHIGELRSRTLNMSVWHAEHLGRNVFLGEVEVSLGLWDWTYTQPLWQDLQPRVGERTDNKGFACKHTNHVVT